MQNELIPFMENAVRVTATASASVAGKTLVSISGDKNADGTYTVGPTGAGEQAFGVASWDALTGAKVTIITISSGMIVPITAGAALTAGDSITADANGAAVVAVADARACGIVLTGAADEADAVVQLTNHIA
jgi:hypothetical protein